MTDQELDTFFIQTLKNILSEYKDYAAYLKEPLSAEDKELMEDYEYVIKDLTEILNEVKGIDDLAELDEETITAVFDYIEEYASNFVISAADNPQRQNDLDAYSKIEEILDLFLDDDDFEED